MSELKSCILTSVRVERATSWTLSEEALLPTTTEVHDSLSPQEGFYKSK